jgi:hypothetical protein
MATRRLDRVSLEWQCYALLQNIFPVQSCKTWSRGIRKSYVLVFRECTLRLRQTMRLPGDSTDPGSIGGKAAHHLHNMKGAIESGDADTFTKEEGKFKKQLYNTFRE